MSSSPSGPAANQPLCFIVMPFGIKPDPRTGGTVNFDQIYEAAIRPAVIAAGLAPIRADQERTGGVIHTPMFERLLLCEYVVADLTTANANVFYELGIRHTALPSTSLPIFASHSPPPFDVNFIRGLPYNLGRNGKLNRKQAKELKTSLTARLKQLREEAANSAVDSPIFQLLPEYTAPDTTGIDSDVFQQQNREKFALHERIHNAVAEKNADDIYEIITELEPLTDVDSDILLHLIEAWRELSNWAEVIALSEKMPRALRESAYVQEISIHALAQQNELAAAQRRCEQLVARHGHTSERYGLLGRVLKSQWQEALKAGNQTKAAGFLARAISAYTDGFLYDHRDTYPGINAITLCELSGTDEHLAEQKKLLPTVSYAHEVRLAQGDADYWAHATSLELAVLANDEEAATKNLRLAMGQDSEDWQYQSTALNLLMIRAARLQRGTDQGWLLKIIEQLTNNNLPDLPWAQSPEERESLVSTADEEEGYVVIADEEDESKGETAQPKAQDHMPEKNAAKEPTPVEKATAAETTSPVEEEKATPPELASTPAAETVKTTQKSETPVTSPTAKPAQNAAQEPNTAAATTTPTADTSKTEKPPEPKRTGGLPPLSPTYAPAPRAYPASQYSKPNKGAAMSTNELPDRALRAKNYLQAEYNLYNQQGWYDRKASSNRKWATRLGFLMILAGAATSIIQLWAPGPPPPAAPPPDWVAPLHWTTISTALLGAMVIVIKGIERLWKFDDNWLAYRQAAEGIKREQRLYINGAGDYVEDEETSYRSFVENIEQIIAAEQNMYWQSSNKKQGQKAS